MDSIDKAVASPTWLKVEPGGIPQELKDREQWVAWEARPAKKGVKPRKVPVDPVGKRTASCDDPSTWNSFDRCLKPYLRRFPRLAGIGYEFSADDDYPKALARPWKPGTN